VKIGELAKRAGISVSTVRFYEAQGLMPKPATRESGYREYEQGQLDRLRLILTAKGQRFPLGLIRSVLSALDNNPRPCEEVAEIVDARLKTIGREIRDLQRLQAHLEAQLKAWKRGELPTAGCLCAILQTDAPRGSKWEKKMANIEVFIAGCPLCDEAVRTVRETACPNCTVTVYDLLEGCETMECREKAAAYGIARVPAVVVDGKLCLCCEGNKVNAADLRAAGVGA
jgi:DNA-binding transcriptional MerR regulator